MSTQKSHNLRKREIFASKYTLGCGLSQFLDKLSKRKKKKKSFKKCEKKETFILVLFYQSGSILGRLVQCLGSKLTSVSCWIRTLGFDTQFDKRLKAHVCNPRWRSTFAGDVRKGGGVPFGLRSQNSEPVQLARLLTWRQLVSLKECRAATLGREQQL